MNCTISGRGQYALLLNTQLSSSYPRTSPNLNVCRRCLWNEQNLHIFCTATDILLAKGRARPSRQAAAHAICSEEASNISNCCGLVKNSGHASSGGLESFKCINILSIGLKLSLLWWHKKYTHIIITNHQCEKIALLNTFCCKKELHSITNVWPSLFATWRRNVNSSAAANFYPELFMFHCRNFYLTATKYQIFIRYTLFNIILGGRILGRTYKMIGHGHSTAVRWGVDQQVSKVCFQFKCVWNSAKD